MIEDALAAFAQIFSPPFRTILFKSLALTLAVLVLAWFALDRLALSLAHLGAGWFSSALSALLGFGLFIGLAYVAAPATSIVASFFFDDIAGAVERSLGGGVAPGRPAPAIASALFALRFAGVSLLVNIIALMLLLAPGVNLIAYFGANAYLLGREYFELAAMRYRAPDAAWAMRRHFSVRVFFYGLIIAGFVAIPVLNLLTPLFATALMTRLHRRLS